MSGSSKQLRENFIPCVILAVSPPQAGKQKAGSETLSVYKNADNLRIICRSHQLTQFRPKPRENFIPLLFILAEKMNLSRQSTPALFAGRNTLFAGFHKQRVSY